MYDNKINDNRINKFLGTFRENIHMVIHQLHNFYQNQSK